MTIKSYNLKAHKQVNDIIYDDNHPIVMGYEKFHLQDDVFLFTK